MSLAALAREIGLPYEVARYRARRLTSEGRPVTGEALLTLRRKARKPQIRPPLSDSLMRRLDAVCLSYGGHLPAVLEFIEGMRSGPHR